MRDQQEIERVMGDAADQIATGRSKYHGLTYEEGVDAALRWVLEWETESPMEE